MDESVTQRAADFCCAFLSWKVTCRSHSSCRLPLAACRFLAVGGNRDFHYMVSIFIMVFNI